MELKIRLIDALEIIKKNQTKKTELVVAVGKIDECGWMYENFTEEEEVDLLNSYIIVSEIGTPNLWNITKNSFEKTVPTKIGDRYVLKDCSIEWMECLVEKFGDKYKPIAEEGVVKCLHAVEDSYIEIMEGLGKEYSKLNERRDRISQNFISTKNRLSNLMSKFSCYGELE